MAVSFYEQKKLEECVPKTGKSSTDGLLSLDFEKLPTNGTLVMFSDSLN